MRIHRADTILFFSSFVSSFPFLLYLTCCLRLATIQLVCEMELRLSGLAGARKAELAAMEKIRAHLAARIGTEGEAGEAAAFIATLLSGSTVDDEGMGRFVDLVAACADGVDEAALQEWEEEEKWLAEEDELRMMDYNERRQHAKMQEAVGCGSMGSSTGNGSDGLGDGAEKKGPKPRDASIDTSLDAKKIELG